MHTPSEPAPTWTAPRLVTLGTAGGSQAAVANSITEYSGVFGGFGPSPA